VRGDVGTDRSGDGGVSRAKDHENDDPVYGIRTGGIVGEPE
jgi:hypothetical protein